MYSPKLILGAELEVEVVGDYDVASYSALNGHNWYQHATLVKDIERGSQGTIKAGTDGTLRDGIEWRGDPLTLKANKDTWSVLFDNDRFQRFCTEENQFPANGRVGANHYTCGMHVHLSGDPITPLTLGKMMMFINSANNKKLLEYVAGRYDEYYCRIRPDDKPSQIASLWHDRNCKKFKGKRIVVDRKALYVENGSYCCDKTRRAMALFRGAINITPRGGAGDCEIRMFKSTTNKDRFFSNLEFCAALVEFVNLHKPNEMTQDNFCRWITDRGYRTKYSYLFKHLRDGGFVEGLVPRLKTLKDEMMKGKTYIPAKPLVV